MAPITARSYLADFSPVYGVADRAGGDLLCRLSAFSHEASPIVLPCYIGAEDIDTSAWSRLSLKSPEFLSLVFQEMQY